MSFIFLCIIILIMKANKPVTITAKSKLKTVVSRANITASTSAMFITTLCTNTPEIRPKNMPSRVRTMFSL